MEFKKITSELKEAILVEEYNYMLGLKITNSYNKLGFKIYHKNERDYLVELTKEQELQLLNYLQERNKITE